MRLCPSKELTEGMVIGKSLYRESGAVAKLNEEHLNKPLIVLLIFSQEPPDRILLQFHILRVPKR